MPGSAAPTREDLVFVGVSLCLQSPSPGHEGAESRDPPAWTEFPELCQARCHQHSGTQDTWLRDFPLSPLLGSFSCFPKNAAHPEQGSAPGCSRWCRVFVCVVPSAPPGDAHPHSGAAVGAVTVPARNYSRCKVGGRRGGSRVRCFVCSCSFLTL